MSILLTEKVELLQINPSGTNGFLRANENGDLFLWDGVFTEGQTAVHIQSWAADGVTTTFSIANPVQDTIVLSVDGIVQPVTSYDITGQLLTIPATAGTSGSPPLTAGSYIELTYLESLTGQGQGTGISDAINGLTNNNNVAELGGTLYKNTNINAASSSFYTLDTSYLSKTALIGALTNINFGIGNLSDFIGVYQENVTTFQALGLDRNTDSILLRSLNTSTNIDNKITIDADGVSDIKLTNIDPSLGTAEIHVAQGSVNVDFNNSFTITDTKTIGSRTGAQYAVDYTTDTNATSLTLATKGYVDTEITGVTLTAGEGIDLITNIISFKNSANLTDNFLIKWDDTNTQLATTIYQDDGTGWAIGTGAVAADSGAVIIGETAATTTETKNTKFISIGQGSNAGTSGIGVNSTAIGVGAVSATDSGIALGAGAFVGGLGSGQISIGRNSNAQNSSAIAIGDTAIISGAGSIGIGQDAATTQVNAIVIGTTASITGISGVAIGDAATAITGVAIGEAASATTGVTIGDGSLSLDSSVAIFGSANNTGAVAIAGTADQLNAISIKGTSTGTSSVAIGDTTTAANNGVAIGVGSSATSSAVAIGSSTASGTGTKNVNFVAIGANAGNAADVGSSAVLIGSESDAIHTAGVAIGSNTQSLAINAIAIGKNAIVEALGNDSIAILANSGVGINNVLIGTNSTIVAGKNSVGLGPNVSSTADSTISIGDTTVTTAARGIAIGNNITAGASGAIMMGGSPTDTLENTVSNSVAFGWSGTNGEPSILFADVQASYIRDSAGLVIGNNVLETSAILELESLTKALLISRIADPATDVTTPIDGMIAYDSTDGQLQAYISSAWRNIGGAGINPTGTANRVTKFTSTGDDLQDSRIIDNGTQYSFGTLTNLIRSGEIAHSNSTISVLGDVQTSKMIAQAETFDAVATEMFLDAATSRITIQTDSVAGFVITLTTLETGLAGTNGTSSSTNPARVAQYKGAIKNIANLTTLVDTVTEIILAEDTDAQNWSVTISANDVNNALKIMVTGDAGKVINWVANIELTETKF